MYHAPPWQRRLRAEALRGYPFQAVARALGYRRNRVDGMRWVASGSCLTINGFMFYDHISATHGAGAIALASHAL